jgi:hypothetical protein
MVRFYELTKLEELHFCLIRSRESKRTSIPPIMHLELHEPQSHVLCILSSINALN